MGGFQSRRPPRSFQGGPDDGGPPPKQPASNFNQVKSVNKQEIRRPPKSSVSNSDLLIITNELTMDDVIIDHPFCHFPLQMFGGHGYGEGGGFRYPY